MLQGMQPAIDRFNKFLNSERGQRIAKGFQQAMLIAGQAVGWVLDKATALGQWLGDHFQTVVIAAAGALALYAGNAMLAAAAHWKMLLGVAVVIALAAALGHFGVTASQAFGAFTGGVFVVGAAVKNFGLQCANIFLGIIGAVRTVGKNIDVAFSNVIHGAQAVFWDLAATATTVISTIAQRLSKLPFVNIDTSGLERRAAEYQARASSARSGIRGFADVGAAWNTGMTTFDAFSSGWASDAYSRGYGMGSAFGDKLSNLAVDNTSLIALRNIAKNTGSTAKSVKDLSDEQLKMVEDVAIRKYTAQVNTTSLTPTINVTVNGSGDKSTANDIASAIADILARQAAAHTSVSYAEAGT